MAPDRDNPNRDETLYDAYFEAAMSGQIESPSRFLLRNGPAGADLRARIETVYALVTSSLRSGGAPEEMASVVAFGDAEGSALEGLGPGMRIGAYRLERVLRQGGMGIVCLANEETLSRKVAVKVIRAGPAQPSIPATARSRNPCPSCAQGQEEAASSTSTTTATWISQTGRDSNEDSRRDVPR